MHPILIVVLYGGLPIPLGLLAIWLAGRNSSQKFAILLALIFPSIAAIIATCAYRFTSFAISKYPQTDFVFIIVLLVWMSAVGGLIGGFVDRVGDRRRASK